MRFIAFLFLTELARFINLYFSIDTEYDTYGIIFFGMLFLIMDIIELFKEKGK